MNIEHLQTLIDVARCGSYAAVAKLRGVDPSQISRMISMLEHELGFRLFQRTTRQLALTDAGHHYLERITPLLDELEQARDVGHRINQTPQGNVRLTTSIAFGHHILIPLLKEFKTRYPLLSIELLLTDAVLDLVAERVDLAIRLGSEMESTLVGAPLMPIRYQVYASPSYIEQYGRPKKPADLSKHDCPVFPFLGFRNRWLFRHKKSEPFEVTINSSLIISNALALLRAAEEGLGPTLLSDWLAESAIRNGNLINLFPGYEVSATNFQSAAWLLYPSRTFLPQKTRLLLDFLKEKLGREHWQPTT